MSSLFSICFCPITIKTGHVHVLDFSRQSQHSLIEYVALLRTGSDHTSQSPVSTLSFSLVRSLQHLCPEWVDTIDITATTVVVTREDTSEDTVDTEDTVVDTSTSEDTSTGTEDEDKEVTVIGFMVQGLRGEHLSGEISLHLIGSF